MKGPGCFGGPLSSTEERLAAARVTRVAAAKRRLKQARSAHSLADLTGDVTEEILEEVVAAEELLDKLSKETR